MKQSKPRSGSVHKTKSLHQGRKLKASGSGTSGSFTTIKTAKRTSGTTTTTTTTFAKDGGYEPEKVRCAALPLLKQRLGYVWEKKLYTDVSFIVGRTKTSVEAHRVILASASEIFENLLFNEAAKPLTVAGKYVLYDNEFSQVALEVFIKAMYTNEIPICLTLPTALEVFYASKKYQVLFLEDKILEHIRQLVTISNVFEALRYSTAAIELTCLSPICWKVIEEQTDEVLAYHLNELDAHTFSKILERDRLNLNEVELFQIAVRWAANLCKAHGMKTTGKNKRSFMEPLIKHFRFTTMIPDQFSDIVIPSRILEVREVQQIQNFVNKPLDPKTAALPYKVIARVNTVQYGLRELDVHSSSSNENLNTKTESVDEIQKIHSDSIVIAPNLGSKLYFKKGASSRLKTKRVSSTHNKGR